MVTRSRAAAAASAAVGATAASVAAAAVVAVVLAGCSGPGPASVQARLQRQGLAAAEPAALDAAPEFTGVEGCMVLRELASGETRRYRPDLCAERAEPCSTFKIGNALIGLQTGVLQDESTVIPWDGTPQPRPAWQQDHTLASAVRESVVPYFQHVATGVGQGRMRYWLERLGYGNADTSSGLTSFWLRPGSLRVSADEQVDFLARLYRGELPVDARSASVVERILVLREQDGVTLSGKTGTGGDGGADRTGDTDHNAVLGWFVGHLRTPMGEFVFATRISAPSGATGRRARDITEAVLRDIGLMG